MKNANPEFWRLLEELVSTSQIVIDRPRGSRHPRHPEIIYPLDYGYLADTTSPDGDGIDVWLGSGEDRTLRAVLLSVDLEKRDSEIKLLMGLSEAETEAIYAFYNEYPGMKALLIEREADKEGGPKGRLAPRTAAKRIPQGRSRDSASGRGEADT